jgi:creatinine amidohydrolase
MTRLLGEMTAGEVGEAAQAGALLLIPIGATEAHGPHLPLGTDYLIAEEVARELAAHLEQEGITTVITPTLPYCVAEYARGFPGTISLRGETLEALLLDLGRSLVEHGFRRAAILCFHLEPGNAEHIQRAALALREQVGLEAAEVFVSSGEVWLPRLRGILDTRLRQDLHGGEMETSVMLRIRPGLVRDNWRAMPPTSADIIDTVAAGIPFKDVGPGYFGAPAASSAEKGEKIMSLWVYTLARVVQELITRRNVDGR